MRGRPATPLDRLSPWLQLTRTTRGFTITLGTAQRLPSRNPLWAPGGSCPRRAAIVPGVDLRCDIDPETREPHL
ncbi:hypothetical protein tb265_05660 [Gemmatimonadetes bacterium T265]|nr:hypothetical protein tb265_05660 [Gemmatimonadetes bacterium T265]